MCTIKRLRESLSWGLRFSTLPMTLVACAGPQLAPDVPAESRPIVPALAAVINSDTGNQNRPRLILDTMSLGSFGGMTSAEMVQLASEVSGLATLGHGCPNDPRSPCLVMTLFSYRTEGRDVLLRLMWSGRRCSGSYTALFRVRVERNRGRVVEETEKTYGDCFPSEDSNPQGRQVPLATFGT